MPPRKEYDPWKEWFHRMTASWFASMGDNMSAYMLLKRMEDAKSIAHLTSIVRWRKDDLQKIAAASPDDDKMLREAFVKNAERITNKPWYEILQI